MRTQGKDRHFLGASLLISSTCMGVGMLALPVATAQGGFLGTLPLYIAVWLFKVANGCLILEACLWCPKDANLITISNTLLGNKGKAACWIFYLFLFYCIMVALVDMGGQIVGEVQGRTWPDWLCTLIYLIAIIPVVYVGTKWVARINFVLIAGLVLTFVLFAIETLPHIQPALLKRIDISAGWKALPVLFTAFGFQNLIPTLVNYASRDDKLLTKAIFFGTSIPLAIYLVWQLLIQGIIPYSSLMEALRQGDDALVPLQNSLHILNISRIGEFFVFFVLTVSFLGTSTAFIDFWADALNWKREGTRKILLIGLVFGVPYGVATINPDIFFKALTYAGGIGSVFLFGILPIIFVWSGRYIQKRPRIQGALPGGKYFLALLLILSLFVFWQVFALL